MHHTEQSSGGDRADGLPAAATAADRSHRRDWLSIIAENLAAAAASDPPLHFRYAPNHWAAALATATGDISPGDTADRWAPWAAALARLGYSARRGRRTGVDLDQAARDYLLLTIPAQPRLPATMAHAREVARAVGLQPQPPCRDRSAARPLQQATAERLKTGLDRFQREADDRARLYDDRRVALIQPIADDIDSTRLLAERLKRALRQEEEHGVD